MNVINVQCTISLTLLQYVAVCNNDRAKVFLGNGFSSEFSGKFKLVHLPCLQTS